MNLFYAPNFPNDPFLPLEEAIHALKVLRLNPGESIQVTNGRGSFYSAILLNNNEKKCGLQLQSSWEDAYGGSQNSVHLAIAPTKNTDRMEWLVEKAVEMGVAQISPLQCTRSERRHIRTDRWEKIAVSAMKQSLRSKLPLINSFQSLESFIKNNSLNKNPCFIAHCIPSTKQDLHILPKTAVTILIGPEGDFSPEEVELAENNGYVGLSLGHYRLRTETAALKALAHFL